MTSERSYRMSFWDKQDVCLMVVSEPATGVDRPSAQAPAGVRVASGKRTGSASSIISTVTALSRCAHVLTFSRAEHWVTFRDSPYQPSIAQQSSLRLDGALPCSSPTHCLRALFY